MSYVCTVHDRAIDSSVSMAHRDDPPSHDGSTYMIRKRRGVIPFHSANTPSSLAMTAILCSNPVYLGVFPGVVTCFCKRVFTTCCENEKKIGCKRVHARKRGAPPVEPRSMEPRYGLTTERRVGDSCPVVGPSN